MQTKDLFWIVLNVKFPTNVSYKHPSKYVAIEEARRLAKQTGEEFVVMESIYGVAVQNLVEFEYTSDIPF
ncbi:MAG TPA: hypothetical protein VMX17_13565 [Candidatus Glassbacteria bacterium]|nr:hypothetical protein [Candidatus Glassbacteria bacterium]